MNRVVNIINLGIKDYKEVWDIQEELFSEIVQQKIDNKREGIETPTPNHLIVVEHPHVYTLGKSGDIKNLLVDEKGLKDIDATYYAINRGGDITYHGPGQLVVYPIFDLENFEPDLSKYLRGLEEAIILTLKDYGVASGRIDGLTGVWLDFRSHDPHPRKICAIGVKTSRWVSMHGLAFNVNANLDYFKHIVPCGIDDKEVTSLHKELGESLNLTEVADKVIKHLAEIFEFQTQNTDLQTLHVRSN